MEKVQPPSIGTSAITDRSAHAQHLTAKIRAGLDHLADSYEAVLPMITEAFETEVWTQLGYRRNGASQWIEDNFAGALGRLSVGLRREIAFRLRDEIPNISTRGIAALAGVDQTTIAADLRPKPEGNPSTLRGPYAAERADPEGWRTITEQMEDPRDRTSITVPGGDGPYGAVVAAVRALEASAIEMDAAIAEVVDAVSAEDDYQQICENAGVDLALYVWVTSNRTFTAWPTLAEFWRTAQNRGWFDVPAFVEDRLSSDNAVLDDIPRVPERLYDCQDDRHWTVARAAAVLGLIDGDPS